MCLFIAGIAVARWHGREEIVASTRQGTKCLERLNPVNAILPCLGKAESKIIYSRDLRTDKYINSDTT